MKQEQPKAEELRLLAEIKEKCATLGCSELAMPLSFELFDKMENAARMNRSLASEARAVASREVTLALAAWAWSLLRFYDEHDVQR
jgi:hypothetical protein